MEAFVPGWILEAKLHMRIIRKSINERDDGVLKFVGFVDLCDASRRL